MTQTAPATIKTSPKASQIISPTFGDNDAKWSGTFLDRLLFLKDLPACCRYDGKGGVYAHDTIHPVIREKIPTQCQGLYAAAQNWERLRIFAILM